jgi:RHS repeat-associated protein
MIALLLNGATSTTYGYDAFGTRVYQISATSSTTTYPYKFYSVASTTNGSTNFATSTEYAFNGDTLFETVDQAFKNGAATGSPQTDYVHPDHLGSTDVVSDQNQNLVETLSYFPYGAVRISSATSTNERRKYIGQFSDDSGLSYLNARYMDPSRGQFTSEDPTFLQLGVPDRIRGFTKLTQQHFLQNPQAINSYGYANDNPIRNSDPAGLAVWEGSLSGGWWLGGGTINLDVDTTRYGAQLSLGPAIGPNVGARLSGSYDPSGSLDPAGLYLSRIRRDVDVSGRLFARRPRCQTRRSYAQACPAIAFQPASVICSKVTLIRRRPAIVR